jgi:hypothetical protein
MFHQLNIIFIFLPTYLNQPDVITLSKSTNGNGSAGNSPPIGSHPIGLPHIPILSKFQAISNQLIVLSNTTVSSTNICRLISHRLFICQASQAHLNCFI